MATIKRFDVNSVMRVWAALYAFLGLVEGLILGLVFAARILARAGRPDAHIIVAPIVGIGALLLLPLVSGAIGTIAGVAGAGLYNLAARFVGGIQVEIE